MYWRESELEYQVWAQESSFYDTKQQQTVKRRSVYVMTQESKGFGRASAVVGWKKLVLQGSRRFQSG